MDKVDLSGVFKRVCLEHTPEVRPGDCILVSGAMGDHGVAILSVSPTRGS